MNRFLKLLNDKYFLLLDGATGTNLFSLGLHSGDPPELWNLVEKNKVRRHYRSFIEAGSDVILTNSFGGNSFRLRMHNSHKDVNRINFEAARILVDEIRKSGRDIVAAGAMGPTGEILEPIGPLSIEAASEAYYVQANALKKGGVDVIWIETISSLEEAKAAIMGAKKTNLPIVLTMSIDSNGRTMMGVSPSEIIQFQSQLSEKPIAIGANCGLGAAEVIGAVINMADESKTNSRDSILVAKANCGIPEWINGDICYSGTPELMANYAVMAMDAGARLIGGCCGTTPQHVASMRKSIDNYDNYGKSKKPSIQHIESKLGPLSIGARAQLEGDITELVRSTKLGINRKRKRRSKK